jgi:hypothetical protein
MSIVGLDDLKERLSRFELDVATVFGRKSIKPVDNTFGGKMKDGTARCCAMTAACLREESAATWVFGDSGDVRSWQVEKRVRKDYGLPAGTTGGVMAGFDGQTVDIDDANNPYFMAGYEAGQRLRRQFITREVVDVDSQ